MDLIHLTPATHHITDGYWQLLRAGDGSIYVLVICEASFVSYECLIKLNDEELRDYHGWAGYPFSTANRINYFVSEYSDRRITGPLFDAAIQASALDIWTECQWQSCRPSSSCWLHPPLIDRDC